MAKEIERKFLALGEQWRDQVERSCDFRQGYLSGSERSSVRVRLAGDQAQLNIKSATIGVERHEYEYAIPVADAREMLDHLCEGPLIEKTRHYISLDGHTWEVDEFRGANAGLIVAEVELASAEEPFTQPEWAGEEVSDDPRYYNHALVNHPYSRW